MTKSVLFEVQPHYKTMASGQADTLAQLSDGLFSIQFRLNSIFIYIAPTAIEIVSRHFAELLA